jgi:hypothetical protein
MTTKIKSGVIAAGAIDANALSDNSITIAHLNCSDGTNGQVLTTDGSGTLSFSTISGYTDSDVETYLNTSEIYTDPTNNTLGIGSSSPTVALEVHKSVSDVLLELKNTSTAGYSGLHLRSHSDILVGHLGYANASAAALADKVFFGSISATPVVFTTADTERMRIDSSGNVGIGTSSPASILEVRPTNNVNLLVDNTGSELQLTSGTNGGTYGITANHRAATHKFLTDGGSGTFTERMRIDSSGNVGIGTIPPNANAKLDVNGVIRLYNASSDPTAVAGGLYYNTTDAQVKVSNGTTWVAVGASVLPTAVSNLYSWWDFSGTYSTIGSGNSTVTDASGNGYTLTEYGITTTENFPSGRSGMRTGASGAGNYFSSSAIPATGGAARTLFAIFYNLKNTAGAYQHIMHYGTNSVGQAFGAAYTSGGAINQHLWSATGASISYTQGRTGSTGVAVIFSVYDGSTGKLRLYDAGSSTGSNSTATYTPNTGTGYGIQVGSRIADSEYGDLVIGECGAYSKALSDSEMDTIANGLLNRWT